MAEHERLIRSAQRTSAQIERLFAKMGTSRHPRGTILTAYRTARRAMKGNLDDSAAVNDALLTLESSVRQSVQDIMNQAIDVGTEQAARDLSIHDLSPPVGGSELAAQSLQYTEAAVSAVSTQSRATRALVASQAAENAAVILGDASRVGLLSPAPILRETSRWIATMVATSWMSGVLGPVEQAGRKLEFKKQAVAFVDGRTTETCLRVNGQIRPMDGMFILDGTPRYADFMEGPPFHWWCRTSMVLFLDEFDLGLTEVMLETASTELDRRLAATGSYKPTERGPAMFAKPKPVGEVTPVILES